MNRFIVILLSVCQSFAILAQKPPKPPKWVEKATKALFTIETTTEAGLTKQGNGFFVGEQGEAVASYEVFRNAAKAVVITASGERLEVTRILGADDMFGVVRFSVAVPKKSPFLTVAPTPPTLSAVAYLLPSPQEKGLAQGAISEITKVKGIYDYYKVETPLHASQENYPLMNAEGQVFAMAQKDVSGKGKTYGLSVAYAQSLQIAATDLLKRTYSEIGIRKAWAPDVKDALLTLMLYSAQQDAKTYLETLNDFIAAFPDAPEGYINRSAHYAQYRNELGIDNCLTLAMADIDAAAKYTANKSETPYNKAKLIFGVITADTLLQEPGWDIAAADAYLQQALADEDAPQYRLLEGDIAFYRKDFVKAAEAYSLVNHSDYATGRSYYLEAVSRRQLTGGNPFEILTLLDSAAAKSPAAEAAGYVLENAEMKYGMALYEAAVKDYDNYYLLTNGRVSDAFYYYREQAKFRADDLQGALQDIDKAIAATDGLNAVYYAEKASVCLRLEDYDKSLENAHKAIELQSDLAPAYRLCGLALLRQDKKQDACKQFNKAKELGDAVVERLINVNCK